MKYKLLYKPGSILIATFALCTASLRAQDVNEAYNLSNLTVQGTARSMGFGGALGSVGGDFSAVSVNPGGLGIYRTSELSFSPSFKVNGAKGIYQGNTENDNNVRMGISNFGIVFTDAPKGKRYERRTWKAVSFAIGMNRVADFNRDYTYSGNNNTSSASLAFEASANMDTNAVNDASTLGYMGYESYIINGHPPGFFYTCVPFTGGIRQINSVKERGAINEYLIALGGNYKEKFMLGATIGIPSLKYTRTSDYTETILPTNKASNPYGFQSFSYNNTLNVKGTGVNLKLGAIYNVADFFRVGAALHTPTIYSITDVLDYGINSLVGGKGYSLSTGNYLPQFQFDYSFVTPMRSLLSGTFILKKFGFITADYEYVSYRTMRFIYPDGQDAGVSYAYEQRQINDAIKSTYKGASNIRVGAEAKITKTIMARAGVGFYGSPYKKSDVPGERLDISVGAGYRIKSFFADFAFVNSRYQFSEQPYNNINFAYVSSSKPVAIPVAKVTQVINNATFTVGVKF